MKKRRKKKQRGGWVLIVLLLLILFVLYRFVFVIRNVEVVGTTHLSVTDIVRAAELDYGNSIFLCNENNVRKGIDSLGEVSLVSLTRRYPSTIVIEVRDRTPVVVAVFQNKVVILDESAYVIGVGNDIPVGCFYVDGLHITSVRPGTRLSADAAQLDAMKTVVSAIRSANASAYVTEVKLDDLQNIEIKTGNNITVQFGSSEEADRKAAWMRAAIADLVQRGQRGGTLDVSSGTKADFIAPAVVEDKPGIPHPEGY